MKALRHRPGRWLLRDAPPETHHAVAANHGTVSLYVNGKAITPDRFSWMRGGEHA